jgi:hypothetical protein
MGNNIVHFIVFRESLIWVREKKETWKQVSYNIKVNLEITFFMDRADYIFLTETRMKVNSKMDNFKE